MRIRLDYFFSWHALLLFTITAFAALPAKAVIQSFAPIVAKVSSAVVNITVSGTLPYPSSSFEQFYFSDPDEQIQQHPFFGLGSGVIIDAEKGYIITNHHIIEDASEINVTLISGQALSAQIIGQDKHSDLALLQIKTATALSQLEFADSDNVHIGDFAIAIGNAFGLGQTVTSGIISALGYPDTNGEQTDHFIQTDAAINSGNSGGALVNLQGKLIGINTALLRPDGGDIGIGFAIPANRVNNIAQQLIRHGKVNRGMLGIKGEELTPELARIFQLDSTDGVFIKQIIPDSTAELAGLHTGDIIISINDTFVHSPAQLQKQISLLQVGESIQLEVIHNGQRMKHSAALQVLPQQNTNESYHPLLIGAVLENMNNGGIQVTNVKQHSLAANSGLEKGDIIITINKVKIDNLEELANLLKTPTKVVAIHILRNKESLYLILD